MVNGEWMLLVERIGGRLIPPKYENETIALRQRQGYVFSDRVESVAWTPDCPRYRILPSLKGRGDVVGEFIESYGFHPKFHHETYHHHLYGCGE